MTNIERQSFVGRPLDDPVVHAISRNPALAVGAISSTIVLVEVLQAARWQITSALAILASAPLSTVVIGSLVQVVPVAITPAAVIASSWCAAEYTAGRRALVLFVVALNLSIVALVVAPWWLVPAYAGVVGLGELRFRRADRGLRAAGKEATRDRLDFVYAYTLLVLIPVMLLTSAPWMPAERLTLQNGSTLVGYVLDVGAQWTSVLTDSDRQVIRVPSNQLAGRQICQTTAASQLTTIPGMLRPAAALPAC